MVVQLSFFEAFADEAPEILADAFLADVDAAAGILDGSLRVIGEEPGEFAAELLVEIVAVGTLQALDGLGVFEELDFALEFREPGLECSESRDPLVGVLRRRLRRKQGRQHGKRQDAHE